MSERKKPVMQSIRITFTLKRMWILKLFDNYNAGVSVEANKSVSDVDKLRKLLDRYESLRNNELIKVKSILDDKARYQLRYQVEISQSEKEAANIKAKKEARLDDTSEVSVIDVETNESTNSKLMACVRNARNRWNALNQVIKGISLVEKDYDIKERFYDMMLFGKKLSNSEKILILIIANDLDSFI